MEPVIRIDNLQKEYQTYAGPVVAISEVNLTIDPGEFVAIMGPSGSGKSTFMNILGCLDIATGGKYYLNGTDVSTLDKSHLAKFRNETIGFIFQGFNLLHRYDLIENVGMPLIYAGIKTKSERDHRALAMLEKVGLGKYTKYLPNQLSGGQQQRVAIARALVNNPTLILADEPTGNLDTKTSHEIMELFTQLNKEQNITIVLITHEHDIAMSARRLVQFKDGKIIHDDMTSNPKETTP